jgi:hypothetical protein
VRKVVGHRVKKRGAKASAVTLQADIAKANARFDQLLEAMANAPALAKKKKRVAVRQVADDLFDD